MPRLKRQVKWRKPALADLQDIHAWLCEIEGANPDRTILTIKAVADALERLGDIGRPSRVDGLRELSVRRAPYVVVYRVTKTHFDILAVYHTRQER
ncbi:MAG: type II toxin-antitoxin system RelE/ParE family toxin [Caulobacterales bacterium]